MDFRHHMRRLLHSSARSNRPTARPMRPDSRRRMFMEPLEPRHLMAAFDSHDAADGFPGFTGNYIPPTQSLASRVDFLSPTSGSGPVATGTNYFHQNASGYGLSGQDVSRATVASQYTDSNGISHLYLQQTFNGLPIVDAVANVSMMPDGRVIAASENFVTGLTHPASNTTLTPSITAVNAINAVVAGSGQGGGGSLNVIAPPSGRNQKATYVNEAISTDPIPAQLVYVPTAGGGLDLAWEVTIIPPNGEEAWTAAVAASGSRTGQVVRVIDLVWNASYNVLPQTPVAVQDPLFGSPATVFNPNDTVSSPYTWHDTNGIPGPEFTDTRGNNVFAQEDTNADDLNGTRPSSLSLDFNPAPIDFTAAPPANQDAAIINAFYWSNLSHDVLARHGYTEAAGNNQVINYGGQGLSNDPVIVDVSDPFGGFPTGGGPNILVTPEGVSPRMSLGIISIDPFTGTPISPPRETAFDATIIAHEYFHQVSTRLTGGSQSISELNALQSAGMGEGWSDWFGTLMTARATDTPATRRTTGNWVLGQTINDVGVRRFPYSFDMTIDPLTLNDFNGSIIPGQGPSEIHNSGEIWASALWDMTQLLIGKYGFTTDLYNGQAGNTRALDLVILGLKLQPSNPTFMQARDAIISADLALNGGANYELIWQAMARRGLGVNASTSDSNSPIVFPSFEIPAAPARVSGTVFNDVNGNGRRDGEPTLGGIVIYNDANNNRTLDAGETQTVTGANGRYTLAFLNSQTVTIRQSLTPEFKQVFPANNGAHQFFVSAGQTITGKDFGDQAKPGKITGHKFSDLNADGIRDPGEPGVSHVTIFVDINNDGKLSIVEPAAVTDNFGRYTLLNVPVGSSHVLREMAQPGGVQTKPGLLGDFLTGDPATAIPFTYTNVTVRANATTTGMDFGNDLSTAFDFGDAPASYGTTLAGNGPRHGRVAGFRLGALEDGELDARIPLNGTGDDTVDAATGQVDDEDGVLVGSLTPGQGINGVAQATITVQVSLGGNSPGKLQGWIDFNQNGTFDASEKVISNRTLGGGTTVVPITVPTNAKLGTTYARFRYGYENDLGPTGQSVAGEVEDYQVVVLPFTPIANPDVFPRAIDIAEQGLIKPNSVDYQLDVLANDTPTAFGEPQIVAGSFPSIIPGTGSTLELGFDATLGRQVLIYTAGPGVVGGTQETFTYRVTDGNTISEPGLVTLNISLADNIAIDDTFTLAATGSQLTVSLDPMTNDLTPFPQPTARIVNVVFVPQFPGQLPETQLTIDGADQTLLSFTAPGTFRGSEIYAYTIDDNDPGAIEDNDTAPSTRFVTVQVVDPEVLGSPPGNFDASLLAAGYFAELDVSIVNGAGVPISVVNVGDEFFLKITSHDLRAGGSEADRGVESAYLDLLFDRDLIGPVPDPDNSDPMLAIQFEPIYNSARSGLNGVANAPSADEINEAGAFHNNLGGPDEGVGPGFVDVFFVRMVAKAATGGTPLQVRGDPRDESATDVTIKDTPGVIQLFNEEVFLRPSNTLTILGGGEGEFVNRINPLDVNEDNSVSPVDALIVINTLNSQGPGSLQGKPSSASKAMIDTNMDSMLSPIDALLVINCLNSLSGYLASHFASGAGGEGEGEGGSDVSADLDAGLMLSLDNDSLGSSSAVAGESAPVLLVANDPASMTSGEATPPAAAGDDNEWCSSSSEVDADAADDLFANLGLDSQL